MNKVLNKIKNLIGMNIESNLILNHFIIGKCNYYILEITDKNNIIKNKIIDIIILKNLNFYWFRSYYELELYSDLIANCLDYIFVIIG